jgi:uncharacterized repeat protein (TIGR03803 family)
MNRRSISLFAATALAAAPLAVAQVSMTTLATFNISDGQLPEGQLCIDAAGNLYGTTVYGGTNGDGVVFELAKGGNTPSVLASFNAVYGNSIPPFLGKSDLIADAAGNLYGTTWYGGANKDGTVYELAKGSNAPTVLASFNRTDGYVPEGSLIADAAGNLYGTTYLGGANKDGTVFEVATGSNTPIVLASFNGADGSQPQTGLITDTNGNLYGTTSSGGASNDGTVFELAEGSNLPSVLASFNGADGQQPFTKLLTDAAGNFYGVDQDNPDAIFELNNGSNTPTVLASLYQDGQNSGGELIADAAGNLYGTSVGGGLYGYGSVFELEKNSNTLITLASFTSSEDGQSYGLVADAAGNLYGTTDGGGVDNAGTVFEVSGTGFVVPEPTMASVLLIVGAGMLMHRRRKQLA